MRVKKSVLRAFASLREPLLFSLLLCSVSFAGEFKAPENPKDDKHWYPEMPDNKEPNATLANGPLDEAGDAKKGFLPHPKGWAHPDGLTTFWIDDKDHGKVIMLDTDVLE